MARKPKAKTKAVVQSEDGSNVVRITPSTQAASVHIGKHPKKRGLWLGMRMENRD